MGTSSTPITQISQSGDNWKIKTMTKLKNTEINFKLGEEFDEETVDGRKCKVISKHFFA
jgi:hypothetical protein